MLLSSTHFGLPTSSFEVGAVGDHSVGRGDEPQGMKKLFGVILFILGVACGVVIWAMRPWNAFDSLQAGDWWYVTRFAFFILACVACLSIGSMLFDDD